MDILEHRKAQHTNDSIKFRICVVGVLVWGDRCLSVAYEELWVIIVHFKLTHMWRLWFLCDRRDNWNRFHWSLSKWGHILSANCRPTDSSKIFYNTEHPLHILYTPVCFLAQYGENVSLSIHPQQVLAWLPYQTTPKPHIYDHPSGLYLGSFTVYREGGRDLPSGFSCQNIPTNLMGQAYLAAL